MKANRRIPGKIEEHSHGLGVVTEADVEQRARELALLDGRKTPNKADREQALMELLGFEPELDPEAMEGTVSWSAAVGSRGRKVPRVGPEDEALVDEELVTEGVEEALHDEMVEDRLEHRENEDVAE